MMTSVTEAARKTRYSRPDSGGAWPMGHQIAFIIVLLLRVSLAVKIKVNSSIVLQLPAEKLTLPCEISTHPVNPNLCLVIWRRGIRGSTKVISGYPGGPYASGPSYKVRARLGSGCSCELDKPNENEAGVYKVEVSCQEYNLSKASAVVNVIILPNVQPAPSTSIKLDTSHGKRSTHDEENRDSKGVPVSLLVCLGVVLLLSCFFTSLIFLLLYQNGAPFGHAGRNRLPEVQMM